jgi:NAD(P)-dependent dehydrogenase (short-subunit alcohol dehydrogenase family)
MFQSRQGLEHYAAAKGALSAMVKGLAVEMGQYGVRVNMIAPGMILTEMMGEGPQRDGIINHFSSITPMGRPGYLSDIEGPAAYLASDASIFQTGDVLIVDGGRHVNSQ